MLSCADSRVWNDGDILVTNMASLSPSVVGDVNLKLTLICERLDIFLDEDAYG